MYATYLQESTFSAIHYNAEPRRDNSDLQLSVSNELNLAMIKGDLSKITSDEQSEFIQQVEDCSGDTDQMSIYINLCNIDLAGSAFLISFSNVVNRVLKAGKELNIYWDNQNLPHILALAHEWKCLLNCLVTFRPI